MMNQFIHFLSGGIFFCCLMATLFFLRFWKKSHDALFGWFALAFGLLAIERLILGFVPPQDEMRPYVYLIRLGAFIAIIVAIINKNRKKQS